MKKLNGIITAILTAVNEDGSFHEEAMRLNVEHCIRTGMSGLFVLGTAGEFYAFSLEEKSHILDVVIDQNAGRLPIIAGCGAASTREAVALCKMAEKKAVDALSVVTPFYIAPTQDDLYAHYQIIAGQTDKPIILYNIPARTGVHLRPETAARLKAIENIAGLKDSGGDLEVFQSFMELHDDSFQVMCGIDGLFLKAFRLGSTAAVSAPSNAIGPVQKGIYDNAMAGNWEKAERWQKKFDLFKELIPLVPPPSITKEAVNILGIPVGPPCAPNRRPSAAIREKLEARLHSEFSDCFATKG